MPLFPRQFACMTALAMELGLRLELRAVYPSLFFIARCILARVTPVDVLVQSWEASALLALEKAARNQH